MRMTLGSNTPGWAAPAHNPANFGYNSPAAQASTSNWDKITASGRGLADTALKLLDRVAPVVSSYYDKESSRYQAKAAASGNLFPRSITDKFPDATPWGPIALGLGLVGVFAVVAVAKRRR